MTCALMKKYLIIVSQFVLMEIFVSLAVRQRTMEHWKYVLIICGDLWHRVNGAHQMQLWHVDNWDIHQKVQISLVDELMFCFTWIPSSISTLFLMPNSRSTSSPKLLLWKAQQDTPFIFCCLYWTRGQTHWVLPQYSSLWNGQKHCQACGCGRSFLSSESTHHATMWHPSWISFWSWQQLYSWRGEAYRQWTVWARREAGDVLRQSLDSVLPHWWKCSLGCLQAVRIHTIIL